MSENEKKQKMDLAALVSLCKRRGFIFQSSEIYGGLGSCWDYGPLGSLLKNNVKRIWWREMTSRANVCGIDAAILMAPQVWKASGHVDGFSDPLVDCRTCKQRFRADNTEVYISKKQCPYCGSKDLSEPRQFNLMFKTHMGPVEDLGSVVYLRPETAQGIFVNFLNCQTTTRYKIPFGIAQIGKSFRNEITPGNFIFRTREFEQMEMQFFVRPGTDDFHFQEWKKIRMDFYKKYGLRAENLQFHPHGSGELAHYAKEAVDVQYNFPMGWSELEGIHNRSDFDLSQHQKFSGKSLEYFDEGSQEKFIPYVIETAVGCDRLVLAFLCDAYQEETLGKGGRGSENSSGEPGPKSTDEHRLVLRLHPALAPYKAAVLPLSKNSELIQVAQKLREDLASPCGEDLEVTYDESASIGKRYRRQDEIGTPCCITVDFDTLKDQAVTIRDRDSMEQVRVSLSEVGSLLRSRMKQALLSASNFNLT